MDEAEWANTIGHDPMTGEKERRVYYVDYHKDAWQLPPSDDSVAHNNYFGMSYSVDFTIDDGYCGPLNYLFYGDDDMWVYLDGKLVADIGGAHSSVGIYVDFWDYIEKGTEGEHTLQIFYTERGASGSSCYMQFTIPEVEVMPPAAEVEDLVIDKTVIQSGEEAAEDDTFEFTVYLRDSEGELYQSAYWYYIVDENGEQTESGLVPAGTGELRLQLKDGYKAVIPSLPEGSGYVIGEVTDEDYDTSADSDDPARCLLPALNRATRTRTGFTLPTLMNLCSRNLIRNRIRKNRTSPASINRTSRIRIFQRQMTP